MFEKLDKWGIEYSRGSFAGVYLPVTLRHLRDTFGCETTFASGDGKINHLWQYVNQETGATITIYDYKDQPENMDETYRWHVGGQGMSVEELVHWFSTYGFTEPDWLEIE
jgi:hypothetical protein